MPHQIPRYYGESFTSCPYRNINIGAKDVELVFSREFTVIASGDVGDCWQPDPRVAPNTVPQAPKELSQTNTLSNTSKQLRCPNEE